MEFFEQLINGLNRGSIYALIALGYTMVYGIAKMLNFAHGDVIMVGAYTLSVSASMLGISPYLGVLISIVFCAVLGVVLEKVAYKPLRNSSPLAVLITAIGVINIPSIYLGSIELTGESIATLGVTIVIMIALTLFIKKTKTGRAMLALSEDRGAAQLMGINVNRTISITFAIGSGLAAVAGVLFVSSYGFVGPYTGSLPGIKAFVAAVLGGIGSIPGAMLGGILLGVIESFSQAYISTQLSDAIVFGVLILVLLVRPAGLLGRKKIEKV